MKVCLVYPAVRGLGWGSLGKNPEGIYTNHGLASISAVLKKAGHEVSLIDLRELRNWSEVYARMKLAGADLFGVYMSTLDYHEAKRIAVYAKNLGVKSIVGGPHPSICSEQVLEDTEFDYVFAGEAEVTFPEFVENSDKFDRLIVGEHPDLDSLPYEDRGLFNMTKILATPHPFFSQPWVSILCGRGCVRRCNFCQPAETKIFGKFRMRSLEHFMGEVEELADKYQYQMLMIDDDSFTLNPSFVERFCDAYAKIHRPFCCQSRADFVVKHKSLFEKLAKVGLRKVLIGFESGNQRILDLLQKDTSVEDNLEAAKICHELKIDIWANIMYGCPGETKEETMDTVNMVRVIKPEHYSPAFYTPIPGTTLYNYCVKNDLLLSSDPAHTGTRSPTEAKIRGVDYGFIQSVMWDI